MLLTKLSTSGIQQNSGRNCGLAVKQRDRVGFVMECHSTRTTIIKCQSRSPAVNSFSRQKSPSKSPKNLSECNVDESRFVILTFSASNGCETVDFDDFPRRISGSTLSSFQQPGSSEQASECGSQQSQSQVDERGLAPTEDRFSRPPTTEPAYSTSIPNQPASYHLAPGDQTMKSPTEN